MLWIFLDIERAEKKICLDCGGTAIIGDLGSLIVKLSTDKRDTKVLDSVLSVLCDMSDGTNATNILEIFSLSDSFMLSMLAIISRWGNLRDTAVHNSFHMALYLLLGLIGVRRRFKNFLNAIINGNEFDAVVNMASYFLFEIQVFNTNPR